MQELWRFSRLINTLNTLGVYHGIYHLLRFVVDYFDAVAKGEMPFGGRIFFELNYE